MMNTRVPWLYFGLALAQAAHSIEEIAAGLPRWQPVPVVSDDAFAIANLIVVTGLLAVSPFVFFGHRWARTFAVTAAVIESLNGLYHLTAALVLGRYFPGSLTAIGLILLSVPIWGHRWIARKDA